ncbi:MAG TPA: carbon-nitrogen family hydrolase [Pirellulales bacterium]|nr:carbon-nitrogen family hydrolase [Pirellulales bacterium]
MRVTCIQLEIGDRSKDDRLRDVLARLDDAHTSDLVLLPELWPCGYFNFASYADESEPIDGLTVQTLAAAAKRHQTWLFLGSFVERDGEGLYNTSLLIDDRGSVVARYRKMHLFGYQSREKELLTRGEDVVVVETPWGKAGLAICYDLRFPELFRDMLDRGAEFFLVTAAWPAARVDAWTVFCRARAMENIAYVFACNGAGTSGGVALAGHSLLVDPQGQIIAEGSDRADIVTDTVDIAFVAKVREVFPTVKERVLR